MISAEVLQNNVLLIKDNVVSDSVKFETVVFKFPPSWNGFTKTAVFKKGDTVVNIVLDPNNELCIGENGCYIPFEVIAVPEFTVSVFGISGDSVATATPATVKVIKSGYAEGSAPEDPTQSEYQQLINLSNETKQIAQSVRDDADNGLFKGDSTGGVRRTWF